MSLRTFEGSADVVVNLGSILFFQNNKYVRVTMNVAMVCQTIIEPPVDGVITRDNIKCKISYTAEGTFNFDFGEDQHTYQEDL